VTTPGERPPETDTCPKCGTAVRPDIDWFCPNPACGYPQFWQPGEHPDETLAGTMRRPRATLAASNPTSSSDPPDEPRAPEPLKRITPATVVCENCQTVNSAARTVCRQCGQRLRRRPEALAARAVWLPRENLSRALLAGGLLLALLFVAALALEPDGGTPSPKAAAPRSPSPTPVTTTTSAAVLQVATASASSVSGQEAAHRAAAVLDNDPATAWVSGRGRPIGESVLLQLPRASMITEIGIANGYQRAGEFARNGRAARVLISFDNGSAAVRTLQDRPGLQTFSLEGQMSPAPSATRRVLIQVLSVRPSQAPNVAISTVTLRGRTR
jgi:hypothetical protein